MNAEKKTPTHISTITYPNGRTEIVSKCFPTERAMERKRRFKGYCKYCYRTHQNWWQMRHEDYAADVVLCGVCEHTSLKENAETG